jgi:hypothetical protein
LPIFKNSPKSGRFIVDTLYNDFVSWRYKQVTNQVVAPLHHTVLLTSELTEVAPNEIAGCHQAAEDLKGQGRALFKLHCHYSSEQTEVNHDESQSGKSVCNPAEM